MTFSAVSPQAAEGSRQLGAPAARVLPPLATRALGPEAWE
jgi:hypothetical protein